MAQKEFENVFKEKRIIFGLFLLFLLMFFLNQAHEIYISSVVFNFSISDIVILLIFIYFVFNSSNFKLPRLALFFFLLVICFELYDDLSLSLISFNFFRDIIDMIKFLALILYFIVGYNIPRFFRGKIKTSLKIYSFSGLIIGSITLFIFLFIHSYTLRSFITYDNFRLIGIMNDPNYFAVLQVSTLPYIIYGDLKKRTKLLFFFLIMLALVASGSKTGFITFISYLLIITLRYIWQNKRAFIFSLEIIALLILFIPTIIIGINNLTNSLSQVIPSFQRIAFFIKSPISALNAGGSARETAFSGGIDLIKRFPFTGVGFGNYLIINSTFNKIGNFAHNTYLQLVSQWGLPLSILFFIYVFFNCRFSVYFFNSKYKFDKELLVISDILLVLLIGSLGLSLQNARMFWIFLGMISVMTTKENGKVIRVN